MSTAELVLVTGASGYIALHTIRLLLTDGYRVRATVRSLADPKKLAAIEALKNGIADASLELVEANLLDESCWEAVIQGCDYVLHMASPFPAANPKHEDELIKPAVDGTLNVLRACSAASVKRVVLTSSIASISTGHDAPPNGKAFTEHDWTLVDKVNMIYEKSKTLAEKAAWDYVGALEEDKKFELCVINPALVFGPLLSDSYSTSVEIAKRMLGKEMPLLPRLSFSVVDVRDVAAAHVSAMKVPEAAGQRHIVSGPCMWLKDMAKMIEAEFKPLGYNIPTSYAPYGLMWLLGRFDASIRMVLPAVGQEQHFDNSRMTQVLAVQPRPVQETIVDMCHSLIDKGIVKKTSKYTQRQATNL